MTIVPITDRPALTPRLKATPTPRMAWTDKHAPLRGSRCKVAAVWKARLQIQDKQRNTASDRKHAVLTQLTGEAPAFYLEFLSTAGTASARSNKKTFMKIFNTETVNALRISIGAPIKRLIRRNDLTDYERMLIVRYRLNCDDTKARQLVTAVMQREIHSLDNAHRGYRWGTAKMGYSNADITVYNN
jgi:hypothetical protein